MIRGTSLSFAFGCACLLACSSAPPGDPVVGSDEDELNELPATVDETALDRKASPCQDFYQFACGGYLASATLASDSDVQSRVFGGNQAVNDQALDEILTKAAAERSNRDSQKISDFQASCVAFNTDRKPGQFARALKGELKAVHDAERHGGMGGMLGRGLRSALDIGGDAGGLEAFQPILQAYPSADRERDPNSIALNIAPSFSLELDLATVEASVADEYPELSAADRTALAQLIVNIDTSLVGAISGGSADGRDYHPIGRDGLKAAMPHIDWDAFLTSLGAPKAQRIVLWNLEALTKIDAVLASTSSADLTKYLDYKLVNAWKVFDGPTGATAEAAKTTCFYQTSAALAGIMERRFVDTVMGQKNTKVAMAMARKILKTFQDRLETTDFLDGATRAEAIVKAKQMRISPLLEPRDRYADVDIAASADGYVDNALHLWHRFGGAQLARVDKKPGPGHEQAASFEFANAFYNSETNQFTVLPGLAHGAFFGGAAAPAAHNFGALGWVIGHEMTHGFDDNGRLFDGHGADRNWWTPTATAAFNERAACFVDQYTGFVLEGVTDPTTNLPAHVDGKLTLGENIADNGGMRTAFEAAKPYFKKGKLVANFTPEQQFFIAAGQVWCEKQGTKAALAQLTDDPHSPSKARVNETLSNFDAFAKTFQCKPEDKMVRKTACGIW